MNNIRLANEDPGCRVQALKIVGFTADIWDTFAQHVCPWWTRFLRGAVQDSPNPPKPTVPASLGKGLEPDDLIEAWTSFFGTSARVYLDLFDDISARAVSGTYSHSDWLADGTRLWSRLAKDWVKAWTYGLEKLPEVTGQGGTHGLDLRPPPVTTTPATPATPSTATQAQGPNRRRRPRLYAGPVAGCGRSGARRPGPPGARARRGAASRLRPDVDRGTSCHHRRPGRLGDRGGPPRRRGGPPADVGHLATASGPLRGHASADRRRTDPCPRAALPLGRLEAVTDMTTSAEMMLSRLLERLLTAAEASLAAGDLEPARATAEEVRAVDPDNQRAALILERAAAQSAESLELTTLVTLLFSDLVGSTLLSERVEPEQLRDLFSSYRGAARRRDPVRRQPRPVLR